MLETLCTTPPEGVGKTVDNFAARFWLIFIHNFSPIFPRIMH